MRRCLIVAFLLIAFCGALNAYVFLGQVWPDGSIVMQMQLGSSSGTLLDGSTSWGQSAEGALARLWERTLTKPRGKTGRRNRPINSPADKRTRWIWWLRLSR